MLWIKKIKRWIPKKEIEDSKKIKWIPKNSLRDYNWIPGK